MNQLCSKNEVVKGFGCKYLPRSRRRRARAIQRLGWASATRGVAARRPSRGRGARTGRLAWRPRRRPSSRAPGAPRHRHARARAGARLARRPCGRPSRGGTAPPRARRRRPRPGTRGRWRRRRARPRAGAGGGRTAAGRSPAARRAAAAARMMMMMVPPPPRPPCGQRRRKPPLCPHRIPSPAMVVAISWPFPSYGAMILGLLVRLYTPWLSTCFVLDSAWILWEPRSGSVVPWLVEEKLIARRRSRLALVVVVITWAMGTKCPHANWLFSED